jgi:hypothetical protein
MMSQQLLNSYLPTWCNILEEMDEELLGPIVLKMKALRPL